MGKKANQNVVSKIRTEDLDEIKYLARFPANAVLIAPTIEDRPQLCSKNLVVFYDYPFRVGFRFPFTPFIRQILQVFKVSPAQLMPMVWRVFWVIENITADLEEKVTLADICQCYEFKKLEMGRVTINRKSGFSHLVEGADVNDRGWKAKYFFVDKESLGNAGNFLKTGWHYTDVRLDALEPKDGSKQLIDKLFKVPSVVRTFAYPVSQSPATSSSMASDKTSKIMSREEMLSHLNKRKRETLGGGSDNKSEAITFASKPADSVSGKHPAKKNLGGNFDTSVRQLTTPVDTYDISFPSDFMAADNTNNDIWPAAEKLLFPAAKERLKEVDAPTNLSLGVQLHLQALQSFLAARSFVNKSDEELQDLKNRMQQAERDRKVLELSLDNSERKVESLKQENEKKNKEVEQLKKRVDELVDDAKYLEAKVTIKVKASMAHKFSRGNFAVKKDLQALVDDYLNVDGGSIEDLVSQEGKERERERELSMLLIPQLNLKLDFLLYLKVAMVAL